MEAGPDAPRRRHGDAALSRPHPRLRAVRGRQVPAGGDERLVLSPVNVSLHLDEEGIRSVAARLEAHGVRFCLADPDLDHNRTVLTLLGPPPELHRALLDLYAWAVPLVDLRSHVGVHPRVGTVDVVPFVPVRGISMQECVTLSRRLGRQVGEDFHIPVFLYARSGAVPLRAGVAAIRRGGSEGLAARMAEDPDWTPDYGPARAHPTAGATIIGAREPLIAFNVDLEEDDVELAAEVARAVRESSGGMEGLMAIGVRLADRRIAQVAMNVTEVRPGVLQEVYDRVAGEIERRGGTVLRSELIGVVPAEAMPEEGPERLRLEGFGPERLLEHHVERWDEARSTAEGEPA